MPLTCPHCRSPVEPVEPAAEEILWPACGSSFRLEPESTIAWAPSDARRTLGKFELIEKVGSGGFGTVYKARDPQLDRTVAIKVPRSGHLADLDRFLREARSVARLRHPAIVPVYEVGEHDGLPYLASEFVQGLTLSDVLSGRHLPPREAAALVAAVADALQYAHEQGVVHRDVKPSNILLDEAGRPHLMDFGLARRDAGDVTMTTDGQVLGTPAYMSPEQARGEGHRVDGRSDVYSLWVVLYRMLTGELPFRGTPRMLLHQVLHDEPKPPRKLNDRIPRDLETICVKAMAKEPARRYTTAAALVADLENYLAARPIAARRITPAERAWRWCRRNPVAAALVGVTGLALLSLVSLGVALSFQSRLRGLRRRESPARHRRGRAQERADVPLYEQSPLRPSRAGRPQPLPRRGTAGGMPAGPPGLGVALPQAAVPARAPRRDRFRRRLGQSVGLLSRRPADHLDRCRPDRPDLGHHRRSPAPDLGRVPQSRQRARPLPRRPPARLDQRLPRRPGSGPHPGHGGRSYPAIA